MCSFCFYPCPCGWNGDPIHECTCTPATITRYQKRISGPLVDRIDIHVDVPRVAYEKLTDQRFGEASEKVRGRVEAAREVQRQRFKGTDISCNADMRPADVRLYCKLDEAGSSLLRAAMAQLQMSARAFHRVPTRPAHECRQAGAEACRRAGSGVVIFVIDACRPPLYDGAVAASILHIPVRSAVVARPLQLCHSGRVRLPRPWTPRLRKESP